MILSLKIKGGSVTPIIDICLHIFREWNIATAPATVADVRPWHLTREQLHRPSWVEQKSFSAVQWPAVLSPHKMADKSIVYRDTAV